MAEGKKGFVLYADQKELFDKLPNEKAGELIKHIFKYVNDENPMTEDLFVDLAFTPIKQQLKRDLERWEGIKESRSRAGKASAEAKKAKKEQQDSTNSTSVDSVQQTSTKSTVIDNVNVNGTVIVKVKEKLLKDVCDFFNVNEIKNVNTYKAIHTFVMVSGIDPKTFEAYKQYKEQSNEITHGWRTFIGDPENKFSDGAWAACDWSAKIKDIPKSKNGIPEEPDQIWIKKNGQNADLWMEACRKWRANGWQYKQQEGATIKTWKQTNK